MRRLPPLRALKAFEAVARHASVTKAADELAVSHSAVSQQIKILEAHFGQSLFVRSGRGLKPTPSAMAFLEDVRSCFDRLALASEQFTRATQGKVLRINATPSFAMRWLIPKSSRFQLENPSLDVRVTTSVSDGIAHLDEPYDFIIRRAEMTRADHGCRRFLDDVSTVVMSPALQRNRNVRTAGDLLKVPLLHLKSRPDAWRQWFEMANVPTTDIIAGPYFDHFFLSLQATINGLGAAMSPEVLVQDDLAAGRLVTPFPDITTTGAGFYVLYRLDCVREHGGRTFLDWLLHQAPPLSL